MWLLAPTEPPRPLGTYGPWELSKASKNEFESSDGTPMSLQAHSAHRKLSASVPSHSGSSPPPSMTISGPPSAHLSGSGPSGTLSAQLPSTQPWSGGHALPQPPQLAWSEAVSTQVPLHSESMAGQSSAQPFE